jgi:uncharacterized protein YndB with AHSA1/START domain
MNNRQTSGSDAPGRTSVVRTSDVEMTVTRSFNAPARIVFEAWTKPELFMRWWVPKSIGVQLRSCEMDVRTGGSYRLEFGNDGETAFTFFGKYLEVVPASLLVWTNEEEADGAVSTVRFVEEGGRTLLTFSEVYPTKAALDGSLGGMDAAPEQFEQLDAVLATMIESGA